MPEKILELRSIKKFYTGGGNVVVGLDGVSMSFSRGEFVAVTGESGSGKSTLAHVICGILPYESGEMYFNGERTSHFGNADWDVYRRDNIGFISQNYGILPGASVMKNVESALLLSGMRKREARVEAESILRKVELWSMRHRRAAKLSSGQKQRLSIARALAKPAPILVADEPTGNLDADNSRKIIELLAKVAEERLVILITHDFAEAEHCATRHIVIKDGHITADIPLRRASDVKETVRSSPKKRSRGIGLYVARLQTFGRPVWSAASVLIFALSAFAVFVFLSVFISNLDDAFTYLYDDTFFPNGDKKRLIAATYDGSDLTDDDIDKMLALDHVSYVERGDTAADVQYAYREDVDYTVKYQSMDSGLTKPIFYIQDDAPFIRTMPTGKDADGFISEGRAPVGFFEVAAERGKAEIGDFIKIYISDKKHWAIDETLKMTFEVVGITDKASDLCFSSDVALCFEFLKDNVAQREFLMWSDEVEEGKFLIPVEYMNVMMARLADTNTRYDATKEYLAADPEAYGDRIVKLKWAAEWVRERKFANQGFTVWVKPPVFETPLPPHSILSTTSGGTHIVGDVQYYLFFVSQKDFHSIVGDKVKSSQISVFIDDYAYADSVLGELQKMGYFASSPLRMGTTVQNEELAAERKQTLNVCFTALAVTVILEAVLLTAMFSVQRESYRTLADIGLTGNIAARAVFIQIIFFSLTGQAAVFLGLKLLERAGVERIVSLMRYLTPAAALAIFFVNLAVSLISGAIIVRMIKKSTSHAELVRPDINDINDETD